MFRGYKGIVSEDTGIYSSMESNGPTTYVGGRHLNGNGYPLSDDNVMLNGNNATSAAETARFGTGTERLRCIDDDSIGTDRVPVAGTGTDSTRLRRTDTNLRDNWFRGSLPENDAGLNLIDKAPEEGASLHICNHESEDAGEALHSRVHESEDAGGVLHTRAHETEDAGGAPHVRTHESEDVSTLLGGNADEQIISSAESNNNNNLEDRKSTSVLRKCMSPDVTSQAKQIMVRKTSPKHDRRSSESEPVHHDRPSSTISSPDGLIADHIKSNKHSNATTMQKLQGALSRFSSKVFNSSKLEEGSKRNKDQKILAIMTAKKEEEEKEKLRQEAAHAQWESEKEMLKSPEFREVNSRRRQSIGENYLKKDKKHSTPGVLDKQLEKQLQAQERKRSVEQRLEQQRREMEEYQNRLRLKQEQDMQRANSVRLTRDQKQQLRAKLRNVQMQQTMEKASQMKQQSMESLNHLQASIDNKLSAAEQKVHRLRQEDSRRSRDDLRSRIDQSRMRQRQIEAELKAWQEDLSKFKEWQIHHADQLTRNNLAKKKEAAFKDRLEKEKAQRNNMKKLLAEEEKRLNEMETTIASKETRIETMKKEKKENMLRSRAMASASQRMREELKTHYSCNDLDQLNRQVALENRLVAKTTTTTRNRDTLELG